jgi:hypothetical protein
MALSQPAGSHVEIAMAPSIALTSIAAISGGFQTLAAGNIEASTVSAVTLLQNSTPLDDLLALREPAFAATTPLQKVADGNGLSLRIDPAADMQINSISVPTVLTTQIKALGATGVSLLDSAGVTRLQALSTGVTVTTLTTPAVKATGTSGVLLLTRNDAPGFIVEDDAVCRAFSDLHVVGRMTVAESILGESFQSGKFRLRTSADSLIIERYDDGAIAWQMVGAFNWAAAQGAVVCDRLRALTTSNVTVDDALRVEGDLHVVGNISFGTIASPFFCNGTFSPTGAKLASGGVQFTVVRESLGVFRINFATPHPQGNSFALSLTAQGGSTWSGFILASCERISASSFRVILQNQSGAKVDVEGTFVVFP